MPIPNCSQVSYNSHHLTNNGVDIYAPEGSLIEAAMSGIVLHFEQGADSLWDVYTLHIPSQIVSHYANLDTIYVHYGQNIAQYASIGLLGNKNQDNHPYLHYEAYHLDNNNHENRYINPLRRFNKCFE